MHPLIPVGPSHEAGAVYAVKVSARPPEAESSNTVVRLARVRLLRLSTTSLAIWSLPVQIVLGPLFGTWLSFVMPKFN